MALLNRELDRAILAAVDGSDLPDDEKNDIRRVMWGFRPSHVVARVAIRVSVRQELEAKGMIKSDTFAAVDWPALLEFLKGLMTLIKELIEMFT